MRVFHALDTSLAGAVPHAGHKFLREKGSVAALPPCPASLAGAQGKRLCRTPPGCRRETRRAFHVRGQKINMKTSGRLRHGEQPAGPTPEYSQWHPEQRAPTCSQLKPIPGSAQPAPGWLRWESFGNVFSGEGGSNERRSSQQVRSAIRSQSLPGALCPAVRAGFHGVGQGAPAPPSRLSRRVARPLPEERRGFP